MHVTERRSRRHRRAHELVDELLDRLTALGLEPWEIEMVFSTHKWCRDLHGWKRP